MRLATPVTSYSLNSTSIGMANGMRVPTFSNSPTCVGIRHNLTLRERILYRIFYTSRPSSALQYLRVLTSPSRSAACFSRVLDMSLKQKGPFSFREWDLFVMDLFVIMYSTITPPKKISKMYGSVSQPVVHSTAHIQNRARSVFSIDKALASVLQPQTYQPCSKRSRKKQKTLGPRPAPQTQLKETHPLAHWQAVHGFST